jgi:pilus assembly protein CpaE
VYPLTAGIVVHTKALWDELQTALTDLPVRVLFEHPEIGDLGAVLDKIERMRPEIVVLDVSTLVDSLEKVIRGIRSTSAAPAVVALNTVADTEVILNAMRAGATEYLYPPFAEPFRAALERVSHERRSAAQSLRPGGRIIGFTSAKGGCGATTLACHTAIELSQLIKGKVLLADLDFDAGLIGFLLKSKSPYTISDAVRNTQRLDQSYWQALVSNGVRSGLEIITAPLPGSRTVLKPEQLRFVLSFVRTQYDWIVLDLGRGLNPLSYSAIEEVEDLFMVTTLEVPALHQAKLMAHKLLETGYRKERLHLLLNQTPKSYELTLDELEKMLGVPVYTSIPSEYNAIHESYSEGKLVDRGTNLGKHFTRLAMKIAGIAEVKKKFSLFG